MPQKGWKGELERHSMAKKGIKTKNMNPKKQIEDTPDEVKLNKIVVVDIDGTLFDVRMRWKKALEKAKPPSPEFWEYFMGDYFIKYDTPINNSAKVLRYISNSGYKIVYLSGRRKSLLLDTEIALEKYGFPEGDILLRGRGLKTEDFKIREIRRLKSEYNIEFMIGDSDSDKFVATQTQIKFLRVLQNSEWNRAVIEKIKSNIKID